MRALRFERFGGPEVLHIDEVPLPCPGDDEVLVEIQAAAINPSDVKNVAGLMPQTRLPQTPGRDFAGIVREGPEELVGLDVFGSGGDLGFARAGTHADYIVLPADAVVPRPLGLSSVQAAAVGVPYVTALASLTETDALRPGQTILVSGATGAVGGAVARLAQWKGLRVLGTIRRAADANGLMAEPLDLSQATLPELVHESTAGRGVDVFIDTVGMLREGLDCLAVAGRMAVMVAPRQEVSLDVLAFYRRGLRLVGINSLLLDARACGRLLFDLLEGFEDGTLPVPPEADTVPLAEAVRGYGAGERTVLVR